MGTIVDSKRELAELSLRELVSEVRYRTSDLLRRYSDGKPKLVGETTGALLWLGAAETALTERADAIEMVLKSQEVVRQ